ncbi:MAG: tetraacyldisaccharide 4-kinase [Bacteroidota bacterium]|jgi:tetraacyldisaccharide 4'-kinase
MKFLLFPFAILYKLVTDFRNHLYNIGSKRSFRFTVPTIVVGNLTVGGTGKTPHVEWVVNQLISKYKLAILSRGYGRKTSGLIFADETASAKKIGDEPFQYYTKFSSVPVIVCEQRAFAIPFIVAEYLETQVIILDDAYQHRTVNGHFKILLSDYNRPFYSDFLLPYGRLREARHNARRADAVIVSKTPEDCSATEMESIKLEIQKYVDATTPIYFSTIQYGELYSIYNKTNQPTFDKNTKVILMTSIANTQNFVEYIKQHFTEIVKHFEFSDHYSYIEYDMKELEKQLNAYKNSIIICTEKDASKLVAFKEKYSHLPIYALPIEIKILNNENQLIEQIEKAIIVE